MLTKKPLQMGHYTLTERVYINNKSQFSLNLNFTSQIHQSSDKLQNNVS